MRTSVSSESPWESKVGFSRAVRVGNILAVAGTAPIPQDGTEPPPTLYEQTLLCFRIIEDAIVKAGGKMENVVRTRVMLTDITIWEEAAKAHGEIFREIRPACTFVEISRLLDDRWKVEIEADCVL